MFEWRFFNGILEYFSSRKENKGNKNSIGNRSVIIFVTKVEQLAHHVTFTIVVWRCETDARTTDLLKHTCEHISKGQVANKNIVRLFQHWALHKNDQTKKQVAKKRKASD